MPSKASRAYLPAGTTRSASGPNREPAPMIFSRGCEHAVRAMLHLASAREQGPVLVRDIARDLDVPFPFLAKIMQQLAKQGLVHSQKGRGGGVQLAKAARDISLLDVVEAIDGLELTRRCLLGLPDCSDDAPCQLHGQWGRIRGEIVTMLEEQTLAGLADQQGEGLHTIG